MNDHKIEPQQFNDAKSIAAFFDNIEALTAYRQCHTKQEQAFMMLATHTLNKFLDTHRHLRHLSYLPKPKKITISHEVALAIFLLDTNVKQMCVRSLKIIGQIDQEIINSPK